MSRDIVLYTQPTTVDRILSNLIIIAEQAAPDKTSNKDSEVTKIIQQCIFDIINELAKEIGLGGEIKPSIRSKLNQLEEKVVPFLIQKDFKRNFIENFKKTIEDDGENDITSIEYKDKYLWCRIKDSNVYLRIGSLERERNKDIQFTFYVEFFNNRNYQQHRAALRGWRKNFLRDSNQWEIGTDYVNFSDFEQVEREYYKINDENYDNQLAKRALKLYKEWRIDGKNIEEIIEECTPQK